MSILSDDQVDGCPRYENRHCTELKSLHTQESTDFNLILRPRARKKVRKLCLSLLAPCNMVSYDLTQGTALINASRLLVTTPAAELEEAEGYVP